MRNCPATGAWGHAAPRASGFYEVRPCLESWGVAPEDLRAAPASRLTYVDVDRGRFDAGAFGGAIEEPLWEWKGPIRVPTRL